MADLARFNAPTESVLLGGSLVAGVATVSWIVTQQTLVQQGAASSHLGRVLGALGTTNALLTLGSSSVASALAGAVGIVPVLDGAGSLSLLAAVLTVALLPRGQPVASGSVVETAAGVAQCADG